MKFSFSELFGIISSVLGVLLMILVLIKMKGKASIRITFILLLLVTLLEESLGVMNYSGKIKLFPFLIRIDSPIHYLLGPAYYFYVLSSLKTTFKFKYIHLLNLLPFIINIIQFMPLYSASTEYKLDYYNNYTLEGSQSFIMQNQYLFKTISAWVYLIAQFLVFNHYVLKNKISKKYNTQVALWIGICIFLQFITFSFTMFDNLTGYEVFGDSYKFAINMVGFLLSSLVVAIFFFPTLLYGNVIVETSNNEKYNSSKLKESSKIQILEDLHNYIKSDEKPYLNPKLSLTIVAKDLNVSNRRLSQVINEKKGINFNDYLNSMRVEVAKQLLVSDAYKKLTIETIALKSGFNSKSPFYAAFKKHTGISPKQFVNSSQKH
ncbi:helix-turn-helix domain-containing protein [Xanthomarina sp. F2636L]|uniref:helix-turn-helix domain-containing protein n=1 Tax=Xanthomarina sp. F2636L TaxID=2996018 RepID=UPI00225DEF2F|nr:helix-turn-helix domain-containing protein [Xanthomarina sp. F2636L]MCX7549469.1 helix-turn-helix domain-containing protein [Xanthomarina sp. F2636L]